MHGGEVKQHVRLPAICKADEFRCHFRVVEVIETTMLESAFGLDPGALFQVIIRAHPVLFEEQVDLSAAFAAEGFVFMTDASITGFTTMMAGCACCGWSCT
jgi:hypothetical protein